MGTHKSSNLNNHVAHLSHFHTTSLKTASQWWLAYQTFITIMGNNRTH